MVLSAFVHNGYQTQNAGEIVYGHIFMSNRASLTLRDAMAQRESSAIYVKWKIISSFKARLQPETSCLFIHKFQWI